MKHTLLAACQQELNNLVYWWTEHAPDREYGGFIGEMSAAGKVDVGADKGIILNARLLWFFSAAALQQSGGQARVCAERAYHCITDCFYDHINGGVIWAVDRSGRALITHKHVYAQAFAIYGLCAYYRLTADETALARAGAIFDLLETCAQDTVWAGYGEAFSADWQPLADRRLSERDLPADKTMNTHLHVLEAYTALYDVWPTAATAAALRRCISIMLGHIVDPQMGQLQMYFDRRWRPLSAQCSFGHDLEASWLLTEAMHLLGDTGQENEVRPTLVRLVDVALARGRGARGEIFDGYQPRTAERWEQRIWWVQAEALVALVNAYQLSGRTDYLQVALQLWQFIDQHHRDRTQGEWHWYSTLDAPVSQQYKVGFWKGPYHNGRAMLEVCKRLGSMTGVDAGCQAEGCH